MTFEEFKALSDEERYAAFTANEEKAILFDDMEAERNSYQKENQSLLSKITDIETEMKKTKELNFTLDRQMKAEPAKSAEDMIHEMFTGGKKT